MPTKESIAVMASRAKAKGTAYEASLVPLFREYHHHATRLTAGSQSDKGDIYMPGNELYVVEAKCHATVALPKWWEETKREAANAGVPFGVIVHKRVGKTAPEEQWATMTLGDWLALVHRKGRRR